MQWRSVYIDSKFTEDSFEDDIEGGYSSIGTNCRKFLAVKGPDSSITKAAGIDYILDAQNKGEIDEDNVLYMIENVNAAGTYTSYTKSLCYYVI